MNHTEDNTITPIRIVRSFNTSPQRLYDAWTTPEDLIRWAWGSLARDVTAEVNLQPGGTVRVQTTTTGEPWAFVGTYIETIPHQRLVYDLKWTAEMGYQTDNERVTVEFEPADRGTTMTFTHDGIPGTKAQETHKEGWNDTFNTLEKILAP